MAAQSVHGPYEQASKSSHLGAAEYLGVTHIGKHMLLVVSDV